MKGVDIKHLANFAFAAAAVMIAILVWVIYDATIQARASTQRVSDTLEVIRGPIRRRYSCQRSAYGFGGRL